MSRNSMPIFREVHIRIYLIIRKYGLSLIIHLSTKLYMPYNLRLPSIVRSTLDSVIFHPTIGPAIARPVSPASSRWKRVRKISRTFFLILFFYVFFSIRSCVEHREKRCIQRPTRSGDERKERCIWRIWSKPRTAKQELWITVGVEKLHRISNT